MSFWNPIDPMLLRISHGMTQAFPVLATETNDKYEQEMIREETITHFCLMLCAEVAMIVAVFRESNALIGVALVFWLLIIVRDVVRVRCIRRWRRELREIERKALDARAEVAT